jgi:DNA-binding GntR family transcriptional regulator
LRSRLSAGTKLTENDLAAQLDISRHPLREAFRVLESEHLVMCVPRKGTYVSEMSIEDLQHLYQGREMIECYAIELLRAQKIRKLPLVVSTLETAFSLSIPVGDSPDEMLEYLNAFAG